MHVSSPGQVPARLLRRGYAAFVDSLTAGCAGLAILFVFLFYAGLLCFTGTCLGPRHDDPVQAGWILGVFVVPTAYFVISWSLGGGQTPAMRMLGIRLVTLSGARPSLWRAAVRWVALALLIIPLDVSHLWGISLPDSLGSLRSTALLVLAVTVLVRRDHRGIHDLVAGTVVIDDASAAASGGRHLG